MKRKKSRSHSTTVMTLHQGRQRHKRYSTKFLCIRDKKNNISIICSAGIEINSPNAILHNSQKYTQHITNCG